MLVIAGIGLYELRDLTRGVLEELETADKVFIETYTSLIPAFNVKALENLIGKKVEVVSRSHLEGSWLRKMLKEAKEKKVVLLAPGDPFIATTHIVIRLEAEKRGIELKVLPAPSIVNALTASTGLQIYKFGRPVTIVKPSPTYFPLTPYEVLEENLLRGLHTLFFLDLKVEEGYFMTAQEAIEVLSLIEAKKRKGLINAHTPFVAVARATSPDEIVKVINLDGEEIDLGPPPHSLVVPGYLNSVEMEALEVLAGADPNTLKAWNAYVKSLMNSFTR